MWMGDVIADIPFTVKVVTVSAGSRVTPIPAGSWFASLYELWRYIIIDFNTALGDDTEIALDEDGSITITSGSNITEITLSTGVNIGLPSTSVFPDSPTYSIPSGALVPCFGPVASYNKSFKVETGYMDRASDGTLYSVLGKVQELRDIAVTLDNRDEDYQEVVPWFNLWNLRWSLGRSVALYLQPIPSHIPSGETTAAESLVMPAAEPLQMGRLIEYTNATPIETLERTFALKAHFPLSGPQNKAWVL